MSDGGSLGITTALASGGTFVEVCIQDTGQGIPEQIRERVFQSFFTTKIKGTGLGLTIVQRVLKNHGGEICMEHPATGGTRVVLRLPVNHEFGVLSSELGGKEGTERNSSHARCSPRMSK
jgi:signal transduction histidine kinase